MIRIDKNQNKLRVRVSKTLSIEDICGSKDFNFDRVIDLRLDHKGQSIPIEENMLTRLRNFFASFEQRPLDLDTASNQDVSEFLTNIQTRNQRTLIITDRAKALSALLSQRNIPPCAEVAYFNPLLPAMAQVPKQAQENATVKTLVAL